ncbi:MAG: CTP synthase [Patescibacteria group bacterium]|jgi:CTP synthase
MLKKYIFVTGGVISGLGKGIAAASIGHILSHKYKVLPIKLDGYLNTDPGTMNPQEHGEVFVLEDGAEVDMDFGHYERFLNCTCKEAQSITMGKVFSEIQRKERKGEYLGQTVQMIPHVTDLIKERIKTSSKDAEITIVEVGGTVGDIEAELYVEAIRQLAMEVGEKNAIFIHLTYIPIPGHVGEPKTKPTQQSVKLLLERGIYPDMILARCTEEIDEKIKAKISLFCNVEKRAVLSANDVKNIYEIPELYYDQGIISLLNEKLALDLPYHIDLRWKKLTQNLNNLHQQSREITIAVCGKYTALEDSYASIVESLMHCKANTNMNINMKMIETTDIKTEEDAEKILQGVDAVIVPGGFGNRGTEGKIKIIQYTRENNIPYLGICLGLQLAVIEYARNVCNIPDATSEEFDQNASSQLIKYLPNQNEDTQRGGTLRLGKYKAYLEENTKVAQIYNNNETASERHRHRYEVNPNYHDRLKQGGLTLAGTSADKELVEFISIEDHAYFVATQAHPELKSKLENPAPLFLGLVKAAIHKKYPISEKE